MSELQFGRLNSNSNANGISGTLTVSVVAPGIGIP